MGADDEVEDLANGEQQAGPGQIDCHVRLEPKDEVGGGVLTHGTDFAQHSHHEDRFHNVEQHQTDQWEEQVQHIKSDIPVDPRVARLPFTRVVKRGVQRDIAGAKEENQSRAENESERDWSAVVEELETDHCVQEKDPTSCGDGADLYRGKALLPSDQTHVKTVPC